ncbi:hypothetical protein [Calothrix sp. FACHB-1219]|uniref:hypothetical protein n=1 Tax=Calothrix sp. FACHB-1219 TaxID=2692778 RepID=UPI0030D76AC0
MRIKVGHKFCFKLKIDHFKVLIIQNVPREEGEENMIVSLFNQKIRQIQDYF